MDFSKAVGVMANHPGHILDYRRGEKPVVNEIPTLFAIPTTVGTGSEVTNVAVVTDHEAERKYVVVSPELAPKIAFVDPALHYPFLVMSWRQRELMLWFTQSRHMFQ